jgi:hypothetical protein
MNRVLSPARILAFVFGFAFVGTTSAAPFQNGSFEGCGGTNQFSIISGIPGWTVTAGNVDWETNTLGVGWTLLQAPAASIWSAPAASEPSGRRSIRHLRDVPGVLRSRRQLCQPSHDQASTRRGS